VPRHGIGQQVQPSSAGSIPHDRVTIPQICSSRALPLHRPRQSTLRYPVVAAKWSPTHSVQRHPPLIHEPLPLRPTRWGGPTPITHLIRGSQIPIVNAAPPISPSRGYLPWRFAYASPTVRVAPPSWGRHPQTFTRAEVTGLPRSRSCPVPCRSTSIARCFGAAASFNARHSFN
jgi:hypothetical protein